MSGQPAFELRAGTADAAEARCYAELEYLASGGSIAALYGRSWRDVVAHLYLQNDTLQSHHNTIAAWADGQMVGQLTYVPSTDYRQREQASMVVARRYLGWRGIRPTVRRVVRRASGLRLGPKAGCDVHLCSVAVLPAWQKRGIASALYHEVERRTGDLGKTCLSSDVSPRNDGMLAFKKHRGYVDQDLGWSGVRIRHMQKRLTRTAAEGVSLTNTADLRHHYEQDGFIATCFDLAEPHVLPKLLNELPRFRAACDSYADKGEARVPYMMSDAVCQAARDRSIVRLVTALLGTGDWVMWGANIREATPNEAHCWHVDLESWLWPSVTVAVGLAGATPEAATQFLPGSHKWRHAPTESQKSADFGSGIQRVSGFGDGRFYAFNARAWHRGDPYASEARVALFLHFQRARDPRVPEMLDYKMHKWSRAPAPYMSAPGVTARKDVYSLPLRYQAWRTLNRLRERLA